MLIYFMDFTTDNLFSGKNRSYLKSSTWGEFEMTEELEKSLNNISEHIENYKKKRRKSESESTQGNTESGTYSNISNE